MRLAAILLSTLLGTGAARAASDEELPAASYDTRGTSTAAVDALKREVRDGFWLETGDALLVVAPEPVHRRVARKAKAARSHGLLRAGELFLLPMGCDKDAHVVPNPIAVVGRHALVRMPPMLARFVPGAQAVAPDSVLAREVRRDALPKGTPDPALAAVAARVDSARWFARVGTLAGFDRSSYGATDGTNPGSGEIDDARDWLAAQFESLGYAVETPAFELGGKYPSNVIATRPGSETPGEWVLIGGHYDSRNTSNTEQGVAVTPGAEDNASGCSGVLELATIFASVPTRRTLVFACYAGEEQGLVGSLEHMRALSRAGDLGRIRLALIMDMIGFSTDTLDLDVLLETYNRPAQAGVLQTFAQLAADHAPQLRVVTSTNPCCSDHMPWLDQNVPGLLTIENDWFQYPHYHRSTDVPANMTNAEAMAGPILRMNAAAVASWAGLAEAPLFGSGFEPAPGP
jgi:hypothetical protein